MNTLPRFLLIAGCITLAATNLTAADSNAEGLLIPSIDGPWTTLVETPVLPPELESATKRFSDFAVWQAADGSWQIWSALRNTKEAGKGRLLHRWQSPALDGPWTAKGVAWRTDSKLGETEGAAQSPHIFRTDTSFRLFYGDWQRICSATSADGVSFQRDVLAKGQAAQFDHGPGGRARDPFVIKIGSLWHCYYAAENELKKTEKAKPGDKDQHDKTVVTRYGAIFCRTSADLKEWSAEKRVAYGGQSLDDVYSANSPQVIKLSPGHYYLLRTQRFGTNAKTSVYHSTDPLDFGIYGNYGDALHFVTTLPVAAPELVRVGEQWFVTALRPDLKGIQMAKLRWRELANPARPTTRPQNIAIRVALFDDSGSAGKGVPYVTEQLTRAKDIEVTKLDGNGIRAGLDGYDVVIFTGGSSGRQANTIGLLGREQVRRFVEAGGGYVGICAGAYLACEGYSWGIKVIDAKTPSSKWMRGRAELAMEATDDGQKVLGLPGESKVIYHNGPVLIPASSASIPDFQPLTYFRTEVAEFGSPPGIMVDTAAIIRGAYGKGRVIVSSPHPEQTAGMEGWIEKTVRAVTQ